MQDPDLLKLLVATAQGDRDAFESLYQKTCERLFAVSLRLLQRRELAEEALQEAYVRVWHNAAQYQQDQGSVMSWLISIARYRALDMLRYANVRKEHALPSEDMAQSDWQDLSMTTQDQRALERCLQELDGPQRQAIHLAYFNGLTHSEVVSHMATPLGTIKSWIRRGLQSLQQCLSL